MVIYDTTHPSGILTSKTKRGLKQVRVGDTQHYLLVLSIDLIGFHRGNFWHLNGSVVVRHLVESKMANSCLTCTLFCGLLWWSCKNCSNTTAEEAGRVALSFACAHHVYYRPQICHEWVQLLMVMEVPLEIVQTTTIQPLFSLTVLPFNKVAMVFMWLASSFERTSHYTLYITFCFNFENISR
jgi:hypothetical protein